MPGNYRIVIQFHYNKSRRQGQLLADPDTLALIRVYFSVKNENARFAKKYNKRIPDRKYAITPTGLFDFGLYLEIRKHLVDLQLNEISYTPEFKNRIRCGFGVETVYDEFSYPLRYFQIETIQNCLKWGCGTIVIGTGGGKSLTTAALIENIWLNRTKPKFKCVVTVPGISLVTQLMSDFEEYGVGFTFSEWGQHNSLQDTDVIITNSENFNARFEDNNWIQDIDLFIVDECHKCGSGSAFSKKCEKIKTPNKFGFTGTLPRDLISKWKVIGMFGPVVYEKNSKELRDEGYISQAYIKILKLRHKIKLKKDYDLELDYVYECVERNNLIRKLCKKLEKNTLILVNHLKQGRNLFECISELENKKVYFIEGDVVGEERERIKAIMENEDDVVVIAMSRIFSTGISINNIHNILFVAYGKSFIRTVQSIGRGLRLHTDKKKLTIIDICDNLYYSQRHVEERKSIYDDEQIKWSETEIDL